MPAYTCPHCQKRFTVPPSTSAAQVFCPHCRQAAGLANRSQSTAVAKSPPPVAKKRMRLSFGWLFAAMTGAGACAMLGLVMGSYFFFFRAITADRQHANTDQVGEEKKKEPPKKNGELPTKVGDLSK